MPTPAPVRTQPVEAISSYAHRTGEDVRVVLHAPRADYPGERIQLRFHTATDGFTQDADVTRAEQGVILEARVPDLRVGTDVWSIDVLSEDGEPAETLGARLLTSHTQPVALLPGPTPETRMRPPRPRAAARQPGGLSAMVPTGVKARIPVGLKRFVRSRLGGRDR